LYINCSNTPIYAGDAILKIITYIEST